MPVCVGVPLIANVVALVNAPVRPVGNPKTVAFVAPLPRLYKILVIGVLIQSERSAEREVKAKVAGGLTTTVLVIAKGALHPGILIEIRLMVVFAFTAGTVTIPIPAALRTIGILPPLLILYITVAFGVPVILNMALFPAQIGVAAFRIVTVGAEAPARRILTEAVVHPAKFVTIFV